MGKKTSRNNKNNKVNKFKSRVYYNSFKNKNLNFPQNKIQNEINEIIKVANDNRPFLKVRILGSEFMGLLDSGAQITIVGNKIEEELQKLGIKKIEIDSGTIKTADGKPLAATGIMNIPFEYNNKKNSISALIVPSISRDFIFGCDFWKIFGFEPTIKTNFNESDKENEDDEENLENKSDCSDDNPEILEVKLTPAQKKFLDEAVNKFTATTDDVFGKTDLMEFEIDTGNSQPIQQRQHRFSPFKLEMINKEIDRLLKMDVIEECEFSSWSNPVVPVSKGDGSCRLCIDARKLNNLTVPDAMPIQDMNRIFETFPKASLFSKVDLSNAFNQIPLHKDSRSKTAFEIPNRGFFMYKRTPFGVRNAPSCLTRLLRKVVPSKLEPEIFVFCDDVIVRANKVERMVELLNILADCFRKAGLTINLKKSLFCVRKLKFLGFILSEKGWEIDPDKIKAIVNYPEPRTVKETRMFIGMLGFFRGFIKNLSELTSPITDLTKKTKRENQRATRFKFSEEAREAFDQIKSLLIESPILDFPDFTIPFTIHVDASNKAGSGILTQEKKDKETVIHYFSRKFNKQQRKYSSVERELLALLWSVEKFKSYVGGSKFKVVTDCSAVTWLKSLKIDGSSRLSRWVLELQNYHIDFIHKKGVLNVLPDALSRAVEEVITSNEYIQDPEYLELLSKIMDEPDKFQDFEIKNGRIFKMIVPKNKKTTDSETLWKIFVPGSGIDSILRENHDSCGHQGIFKTFHRIKQKYTFPRLYQIVKEYVRNCDTCRSAKSANAINRPPMGSQRVANRPFELVSLDFMGPLPRTRNGNTSLLVIVDYFSKFTIIQPMKSQDSVKMVDFLENNYFSVFGVCSRIISDNGKQFQSKVFKDLLSRKGIVHQPTAVYFPQANNTERVNKVIGETLRCYVNKDHRTWDNFVGLIQTAINSSKHESTSFTPYFTLFGTEMILNGNDHEWRNYNVDLNRENDRTSDLDRQEVFAQVQGNMTKAFNHYRHYYNLRTRPQRFSVGDTVFKINYVLSSKKDNFCSKLAHKRIKCRISEVTGNNTYRLEDLSGKDLGIYSGSQIFR